MTTNEMPPQLSAEELFLALLAYGEAVEAFGRQNKAMAEKCQFIVNWLNYARTCFEFNPYPIGHRLFTVGEGGDNIFEAISHELWIAGEHMLIFQPNTLFHEHKYSLAMTAVLMHLEEANWQLRAQ